MATLHLLVFLLEFDPAGLHHFVHLVVKSQLLNYLRLIGLSRFCDDTHHIKANAMKFVCKLIYRNVGRCTNQDWAHTHFYKVVDKCC